MQRRSTTHPEEPLRVSILAQGSYLIASIHTALDDGQLKRFQSDLINQIGETRSRGVIIDVAAVDVLDSFASHILQNLARAARLRGAESVIVGIKPDVALAMVQLGMQFPFMHTALDLQDGLAHLDQVTGVHARPDKKRRQRP